MVATELRRRLGIELDIAGNGREAVEMARGVAGRSTPRSSWTCRCRSSMDWAETTRVLRADPRPATIPIIAMTANAMKADLDACLAAGMNDHVTKPIERKRPRRDVAALAARASGTQPPAIQRAHADRHRGIAGPADLRPRADERPRRSRDSTSTARSSVSASSRTASSGC